MEKICEYILVISPPEELQSRIHSLHEEFYAMNPNLKKVHVGSNLVLVNFLTLEKSEEKIGKKLYGIAERMTPFDIEIKNFNCLPGYRIFLDIVPNECLQSIQKEIKEKAEIFMTISMEHLPHYPVPHFNIARHVTMPHFEKAWRDYVNKAFGASFTAEKMILKKRYGYDRVYEVVWEFEFGKPLPDRRPLSFIQ